MAMIAALPFSCSHSVASVGANKSVFNLKVGDCLVPPTAIKAEINSIKVVSCSQPHTQEVFAKVQYGSLGTATTVAGTGYPGVAPLETYANGACLQQFAGYVGVDYRYSSLYYTYMLPSARSWSSSMNDRTIWCLVTTTGQQLTASVKGSRR